jgi:hypothetical protein
MPQPVALAVRFRQVTISPDVFVGVACRQEPEQREYAGDGEVGESQHDRARRLVILGVWKFAGRCLWMSSSAPTLP